MGNFLKETRFDLETDRETAFKIKNRQQAPTEPGFRVLLCYKHVTPTDNDTTISNSSGVTCL
jgi:hypothetical protein